MLSENSRTGPDSRAREPNVGPLMGGACSSIDDPRTALQMRIYPAADHPKKNSKKNLHRRSNLTRRKPKSCAARPVRRLARDHPSMSDHTQSIVLEGMHERTCSVIELVTCSSNNAMVRNPLLYRPVTNETSRKRGAVVHLERFRAVEQVDLAQNVSRVHHARSIDVSRPDGSSVADTVQRIDQRENVHRT